jgi:anaerobic magnesium-protoporphyrin IX monomethyl ester cyclase
MKTVLVGPDLEENLSISYLSGALRESGYECSLLAFNRREEIPRLVKGILRSGASLLGLSMVAQRRYGEFQLLVDELRSQGYRGHITAGGHFASLRALEVLRDTPGIDSILHHDGEGRIVALLDILSSGGELPGTLDGVTWRRRDGTLDQRKPVDVAQIDTIPFPSRRKPDGTLSFARAPIVSSRGCAGACSFCSIHAWHRQVPHDRLRFRSPAEVAREMIALYHDHRVRVFVFHDDNFIHPDQRKVLTRCEEILETAERGIGEPMAFVIKCRPDDVRADLFRYLREKGLVRAYVGIESNSCTGLNVLNRRTTPAVNGAALDLLRQLGVYACFNLLIFHPDSTLDEIGENLRFLNNNVDLPFDVSRTELYACSGLEERMVREGRALGDYRGFDYRIADRGADLAFRLFSDILWERHFGSGSIVRRAQDLGFRMNLLRRFSPAAVPRDLVERTGKLIRAVNSSTVEFLSAIREFASGGTENIPGFSTKLREEADHRVRKETLQWIALSLELQSRAFIARHSVPSLPSFPRLPEIMARAATAVPFLGMAIGSISCSDNTQVCDPPPPPMSYTRYIAPLFKSECATPQCHSSQGRASGLVLETDSSYANIVNVSSQQAPAMKLIAPGDTAHSYLVKKLEGTQASAGGSGAQMPPGSTPDPTLIINVHTWMEEGAPDN